MAEDIITISDIALTALQQRGENVLKQIYANATTLVNLSTDLSKALRALYQERPDDPKVEAVKTAADKLMMGIRQQGGILQEAAAQTAVWRPEWQVEM